MWLLYALFAQVASAQPDLEARNARLVNQAPPGVVRSITFDLGNEGTLDVASATVRVYESGDSAISTADSEVELGSFPVVAGTSSGRSIDFALSSAEGTFWYGVCVDLAAGETNGTNNCSNGVQVDIDADHAPDLAPSNPMLDLSAVQIGSDLQFGVQVENFGGIGGSGTLRLVRSMDSTIDPADPQVSGVETPVSAPPTHTQSWFFEEPGPAGTVWYGACVDGVAEELLLANNCSAGVQVVVTSVPPTSFLLTVAKAGSGTGFVSSNPEAISCGPSCSASFQEGTTVVLSAQADGGSSFAGWSGDCSGMSACSVAMDQDRSAQATFSSSGGGTVPDAPDFLRTTGLGMDRISLAWNDNSNNEDGFMIERKRGAAGPWTPVATLGPGTTGFTDTGLSCATSYAYRVWAFNSVGDSARSNERRDSTGECSALSAGFTFAPVQILAEQRVSFTDSSSGNPTSWLWDFGDGTTSTRQSPTHTFQSTGIFEVSLTVSDGQATDSAVAQVVVSSPVPLAGFSFRPAAPTVGQVVAFSNSSTGPITSYSWDFGDGSVSSSRNPSHVFEVAGIYRVTLQVLGPSGLADSTSRNVTVSERAAGVEFTSSSFAVREGAPIQVVVRPGGSANVRRSVEVSVQEGSAHAGEDYSSNATIELTWQPGDAADKQIVVATVDDAVSEGSVPETLSLSLRAPLGHGFGARTVATIQILDNDFEIDSAADFERDRAAENGVTARNGRGLIAIAWQEPDGDDSGVFFQVVGEGGRAGTPVLRANESTRGRQSSPALTWLPDGGLAIVWKDDSAAARGEANSGIVGRFFNPNGSGRGEEIPVSSPGGLSPDSPDVSSDGAGDVLVGWQEDDGPHVSVLDEDGRTLVPERRLPEPDRRTTLIDFDKTEGGDFIMVWKDPGVLGGVRAQRFGNAASPQAPSFLVTASPQADLPVVAMDDGGSFVVSWQAPSAAAGLEVWAQRFGPDDAALTPLLLVNSETDGDQSSPSISANGNGDFAITFESRSATGAAGKRGFSEEVGIVGRFFSPLGEAFGEDVEISGDSGPGSEAVDAADPHLSLDEDDIATVVFTRRTPDGLPSGLSGRTLRTNLSSVDCDASLPGSLCLGQLSQSSRFKVTASWQTSSGDLGAGKAIPVTTDSGYFWFFDQENVELVVKVLDGCVINGHYWVFAGGLTDVQVSLAVEDVFTGRSSTYFNSKNKPFLPVQDTSAFSCEPGPKPGSSEDAEVTPLGSVFGESPTMSSVDLRTEAAIEPDQRLSDVHGLDVAALSRVRLGTTQELCDTPEELCLSASRFAAKIDWTAGGNSGRATPANLTDDTGYFWFFDEANIEVVVKTLDGCAINGHFWVFAGGLTDTGTTLTVRDRLSGEVRTYLSTGGNAFQPLQDVMAFPCS